MSERKAQTASGFVYVCKGVEEGEEFSKIVNLEKEVKKTCIFRGKRVVY